MMGTKYKVKRRCSHDGTTYEEGALLVLEEYEAAMLGDSVEPEPKVEPKADAEAPKKRSKKSGG